MSTEKWKSAYRPQRAARIEDIAQTIHDTVSMDEVVRVYLPELRPRNRRIPCPIHHGEDYNLSYTEHGYKCFVCGASGDVINFVRDVCELKTRSDAMKRLNKDLNLNLPINGDATPTFSAEVAKRRQAAEARKRAHDEWVERYHRLSDEWISLDNFLCSPAAKDPANAEERARAIGRKLIVEYSLDAMPEEPR